MTEARPTGKKAEKGASLTTYSIRLSESERALLTRVLEARGWTAAHFIRQATLEKAAHIDNTSHFIDKVDFDSWARRLAKQLCEPAVMVGDDESPESGLSHFDDWVNEVAHGYSGHVWGTTEPRPLATSDVAQFREAVYYGGVEFLRRVLDECDRLVVHKRSDLLPPPVDPAKLG